MNTHQFIWTATPHPYPHPVMQLLESHSAPIPQKHGRRPERVGIVSTVLPAPSVFLLGGEVKEIFHLSPLPWKKKVLILCCLPFCVKVTKAGWLIAGMIRRSQRYPNPAPSMSKLMSLFASQNQTGVACVRIRYLQFNPDDRFIMEKHPSPYHPERQPPRDEVSRAPVPPQLKLQALKAELKEDVQLLQETGLRACQRHVLVRIFKGLGEN